MRHKKLLMITPLALLPHQRLMTSCGVWFWM